MLVYLLFLNLHSLFLLKLGIRNPQRQPQSISPLMFLGGDQGRPITGGLPPRLAERHFFPSHDLHSGGKILGARSQKIGAKAPFKKIWDEFSQNCCLKCNKSRFLCLSKKNSRVKRPENGFLEGSKFFPLSTRYVEIFLTLASTPKKLEFSLVKWNFMI